MLKRIRKVLLLFEMHTLNFLQCPLELNACLEEHKKVFKVHKCSFEITVPP